MWARIVLIVWLLASLTSAYTLQDFAGLSAEWLRCRNQGYSPIWDLDRNGCVELNDVVLFAERWLTMSDPQLPQKIRASGDINPPGVKNWVLEKKDINDYQHAWCYNINNQGFPADNTKDSVLFGIQMVAGGIPPNVWSYYQYELKYIKANDNKEYEWSRIKSGALLPFPIELNPGLYTSGTAILDEYKEPAYSYQTTKLSLREEVADYLGLGRDKNKWSNEDISRIDSIIRKGLLQFYYPPAIGNLPPHQWSFLNPIVSFKTEIGVSAYELAPNFAGLAHPFVMVGADPSVEKIAAVGEGEIRYMQQASPNASGRPKAVAVRPKDKIAAAQQRWEMLIFPKPDAEYTITYSMKIIPLMLEFEDEIPYGCGAHVDTIIASCLAAAEARMNNEKGRMWDDFMERLTASIEQDMQMSRIHYFGYNGDNSDALLNYSRAMARGFTVTVYGQIPY